MGSVIWTNGSMETSLLPIVIWLAILGKSTAATYPHVEHMVNRVSLSRQSENGTENDRELAKTTEHSLHDVSDRVIELRGIIEKGKSEKDSTDRDLYQYLSDFQEQEKKFNDQFQELICTLNESQLSDIIDEMNKLQDQAQMAWDLKQKQLTDLDEILHHENYTDTALANNEDDAKKEDDVQKECASLAAYLGKANETAQAELMELDKHEEEVEKLQNKLEDCVCPCVWGVWSDWSECTKTCKAGSQSRKRIVAKIPRNGGGCKGGSVETITCNTEVCCPVDCVWGIWEPWPDCPSGCPLEGGQHEKIRTRDRKVEASCNGELCRGKDYEKQPCSREEEVLDMLGTCLSGKVHLAKEMNEMTEDLKKCKDSASTAKAKDHSVPPEEECQVGRGPGESFCCPGKNDEPALCVFCPQQPNQQDDHQQEDQQDHQLNQQPNNRWTPPKELPAGQLLLLLPTIQTHLIVPPLPPL